MADPETTREEELRRLLTDAIEVQLAALKAGISFWTEWIEQTSSFVNSATKTLSSINLEEPQAKDLLLELVDAGRASARSMTEIPRHTATKFLEELDRLAEKKAAEPSAGKKTASGGARKKTGRKVAKKRRGTAKKTGPSARKGSRGVAKKTGAAARKKSRPRPKRAGRVKE